MEIEHVEWYPTFDFQNGHIGDVRLYVCDWGTDINGVQVQATLHGFMLRLPFQKSKRHDTGEEVEYPIISFVNPKQKKEFFTNARRGLKKWLRDWYKEHPEAQEHLEKAPYLNSLLFPKKKKKITQTP